MYFLRTVPLLLLLPLLAAKAPKPPDLTVVEFSATRGEELIGIDASVRNPGVKPINEGVVIFPFFSPEHVGEFTALLFSHTIEGMYSLPEYGGNGDQVAIVDSAKIVRTGSLELQVADVTKALTGGREAMAALGGYIGSSQQQRSGDQTVATVTYRIPVARWEDALAAMRGLGTVISEATDAAEVTAQIVDLDARIRNLKASEVALVGYRVPGIEDARVTIPRIEDAR